MLHYERQVWNSGCLQVAGIDEAGRGPLAGPVVAAAVLIERTFLESEETGVLDGLTDSKQLSEPKRNHFYEILTGTPQVTFAVSIVEAGDIDRLNILKATHQAMQRALSSLDPVPGHALVDGRDVPGLPCASTAIVKGDVQSLSIAAASVLAKVTRDRIMVEFDETFPGYGFARHKGYGTRQHLDALRALGPTPCHRRSFRPVAETYLDFS